MAGFRGWIAVGFLMAGMAGAQTKPVPSPSPVGHWIADKTATENLSLWWDFQEDGKVTVTAGGVVRTTYKLDGSTLTVASPNPGGNAGVFEAKMDNGKLIVTAQVPNAPTMGFSRVSPIVDGAAPIVGAWMVTDAPPAANGEQEEMRLRMMAMVVVYGADGSYQARMPVATIEGTWSKASHTYTLKDHPALAWGWVGKNLRIAVPPEGKETHVYHDDTLMDQLVKKP